MPILLLGLLGLLGLRLAAHDAGHLDLLVLALLIVGVVRVGLGLSLVQISVVIRQSVLAHFDLFALAVLVAGDLLEGLGLGDALLLHLNPAEFLGHRLHDPLALDEGVVVAVVAGVEIAGTREADNREN